MDFGLGVTTPIPSSAVPMSDFFGSSMPGQGMGMPDINSLLEELLGSVSKNALPQSAGMPSFGSGMPSFGSGLPSFGSEFPSFGSDMSFSGNSTSSFSSTSSFNSTSSFGSSTSFNGGPEASSAAGTLASYMKQNGIENVDLKDLSNLAENKSGDVPEGVQKAAKYMLENPDQYEQIETHDQSGLDGKSGVSNFEWAAQGGSNGGQMDAQSASGTLASYMDQNGIQKLDMNDLYKLSENKSGDEPEGVQNAAEYMLENPDQYKQIETHDVAGADGISGIGNFQWAAQGGLSGS
jgi:hypothetical protein